MKRELRQKTKKILGNANMIWNLKIGIDQSDHLYPVCNNCDKGMELIDFSFDDACIDLFFYCSDCNSYGKRRFIYNKKTNNGWYQLYSGIFGQKSAIKR